MPRGGRRHAKPLALHRAQGSFRRDRHAARGDSPQLPPSRPPAPPKDLPEAERAAYLEIARQATALGVYDRSRFSMLKLAAKALGAVYAAPADLKATSMRALIETAARMLGRWGLDPVAARQVTTAVSEAVPEPDDLAEFAPLPFPTRGNPAVLGRSKHSH